MNSTLINFLVAIKNASLLKRALAKFFFNKNFILLAKILYKEGLIQDFWLEKKKNFLCIIVALKSQSGSSNYNTLKIISKSSISFFFSYKDIIKLYEKRILYIFSTSFGYLTSLDCKKKKIGGLLFFYVK